MKSSLPMFLIILFLLAGAPALFADGDSRATTKTEKEYSVRVQTALEKALPPMSNEWTPGDRSEIKAPERTIPEAAKYPFRVEFRAEWRDLKKLETSDLATQKAIEELAKTMVTGQKDMEATITKSAKLAEEMMKANEKGNQAEVERLQKEMELIQKQVEQTGKSQDQILQEKLQPLKAKDAHAAITVEVNSEEQNLNGITQSGTVNSLPVYRSEPEPNSDREGYSILLLGTWQEGKDGDMRWMKATLDPAAPSTMVQTVKVTVQAEKERALKMLNGMDLKALNALLKTKN